MKVGFIGIGKLGLDCAEVFAEKHEVRGYDIYPRTSDTVKVCDIEELCESADKAIKANNKKEIDNTFSSFDGYESYLYKNQSLIEGNLKDPNSNYHNYILQAEEDGIGWWNL